jgi:hypothetical protein
MAQDKSKPGSQDAGKDQVQGEGNYEAARRYEDKLRDHVQHHDVEREARDAEPQSEGEKREMERAEEIGKQRAKEEDSLLDDPEGIDREQGADAGKARPR